MTRHDVIVVEDDPTILSIAVGLFEDQNIPVKSFINADDALFYMYEHADSVSVIFTDLRMPGRMDGLILAEIVGRHWPAVKVLLTSGLVWPMGNLPRNVRFISKPWAPDDVLAEYHSSIAGSALMVS